MPDIYISRSGMQNKELDEKFKSTEIELLNSKIQHLEQQIRLIADRGSQALVLAKNRLCGRTL